jgi:uncharacterized repeat protein (TIGR03806 family)
VPARRECSSRVDGGRPPQGRRSGLAGWVVALTWAAGCGSGDPATTADAARPDAPPVDAARSDVGAASESGPDAGGDAGVDVSADVAPSMPIPGACTPPLDIKFPYQKLSQTGCVNPANPTQLDSKVIPYEVNSPVWSDNAAKTRGMVIPAGKKIHVKDCVATPAECRGVADNGKWVLPVGTVMVQNFLFDQKFVETRLLVHFDETTWVGYGYQWDEAQTEATLVPDQRATITFNTGMRTVPWTYPHRQDCTHCHDPAAGSALGLETAQLNRVVGGVNQITRLASLNLFETPPAQPYLPALVAPFAIPGQLAGPPPTATLDQRARSYLHGNCAFCHRPSGAFELVDLRNDVLLRDRYLCNAIPDSGDVGITGALNLIPGNPMLSVIWIRMTSLDAKVRMPEIGSAVVDPQGTTLIADWIRSIAACPM